jgi:Hint module
MFFFNIKMSTSQMITMVAIAAVVSVVVIVLVNRKKSEDEESYQTRYSPSSPMTKSGKSCFSGDSLVTMDDGSLKPISEVKVGDRVMSGKSKESVNVIALFGGLIENGKLFGMNGIAPFATTDHCFLTPSYKFSCIDTQDVIQIEHKNEKDVVQLEEGTELLLKHVPVLVNNITYQDITMFNVYNLITEDNSYVVNDFSVSDGFPDIYSHPIVAQGIIKILLSLGQELDAYDSKNKKTSELFNRYKDNISFDADVPSSLELAISTFFELTQKHENYIKIAFDLWQESFHDFYKLANATESAVSSDSSSQQVVSVL